MSLVGLLGFGVVFRAAESGKEIKLPFRLRIKRKRKNVRQKLQERLKSRNKKAKKKRSVMNSDIDINQIRKKVRDRQSRKRKGFFK